MLIKRHWLTCCALLLLTLLVPVSLHAEDIARLQAGVVKVTAKPPSGPANVGTGFIVRVDKDATYIVTAAHVVAGDTHPKVEFFTKRNLPVTAEVLGLEGDDEVRGLALLVVRGSENLPKGLTALSLAGAARLTGGEDIVVIGFPRNAGPWAVVKGNISSRQGRDIYFSPSVESGHSGGPIFQGGKIVAMVGAGSQSVARGVTAKSVQDYIEGFGIKLRTPDLVITGKDGAPMVLIPAGRFLMGSTKNEVDRTIKHCVKELGKDQQICEGSFRPELPQHEVRIDAFYLDKHEVTGKLFEQFVQQARYQIADEQEGDFRYVEHHGELPVFAVSWADAVSFCRWAGKRLPTEAEWEYAARAGTTTRYWWGEGNSGARLVENIGDEKAMDLMKAQQRVLMSGYNDGNALWADIASYEANPWELYDISGNVKEWTADWFDENYYSKSSEHNPKGPVTGELRVVRGGSIFAGPDEVRSAFRTGFPPSNRHIEIGFRCAQDVPN